MFNKVLKETNLFFCEAGKLGGDVMLSCTKHRNETGDNVSFILQKVYLINRVFAVNIFSGLEVYGTCMMRIHLNLNKNDHHKTSVMPYHCTF